MIQDRRSPFQKLIRQTSRRKNLGPAPLVPTWRHNSRPSRRRLCRRHFRRSTWLREDEVVVRIESSSTGSSFPADR